MRVSSWFFLATSSVADVQESSDGFVDVLLVRVRADKPPLRFIISFIFVVF